MSIVSCKMRRARFGLERKWILRSSDKRIKVESTKGNNLAQLKDTPVPWISSDLRSKSQEITLARLRSGHTRLTHTHLISDLMPLSCPHCDNDLFLTVDNLFKCPNPISLRDSYKIPQNCVLAFADHSSSFSYLFPYVHGIGFLSRI